MSTASVPLAMSSYFTKWRGGYRSWKGEPTDLGDSPPKINEPNTYAAPKGSTAGVAFNQVPDNYLATDHAKGWYPKHRPLKIWRRSYGSTSGKVPIGAMDIPGGTIFRNDLCTKTSTVDQTMVAYRRAELERELTIESVAHGIPITLAYLETRHAAPGGMQSHEVALRDRLRGMVDEQLNDYIHELEKKGGCGVTVISDYATKENKNTTCCRPILLDENGNVIQSTDFTKQRAQLVRNGSTFGTKYCNEDKKYYTTTGAYLKARCANFSSKATTARPAFKAVKDPSTGATIYVDYKGREVTDLAEVDLSQFVTGCSYNEQSDIEAYLNYKLAAFTAAGQTAEAAKVQALLSQLTNRRCCAKTTYKPSNAKFSKNGAVSSSGRIARLKYDTVTKAAQGQKNVWGPEAAAASAYSGRPEMPFTTKAKYAPCVAHRINGTKTACFYINPSNRTQL